MPGRWAEARPPSRKELAATMVLALPLDEVSVKVSAGPPGRRRGRPRPAGVGGRGPAARVLRRRRSTRRDLPPASPCPAYVRVAGRDGADVDRYRSLSLWWDTLPGPLAGEPRGPLDGDTDADVAIVGAGYTGLWTAYYLAKADPSLRVVVRRGGDRRVRRVRAQRRLVLGAVPGVAGRSSPARYGRDAAVALQRAMFDTVDEVGRVAEAEGIDCHCAKGGTVGAGPHARQLERAAAEVDEARPWGFGDDDYALARRRRRRAPRLGATDVLGGDVHPALRGDPPGAAGPRARPGRRAARASRSTSARR